MHFPPCNHLSLKFRCHLYKSPSSEEKLGVLNDRERGSDWGEGAESRAQGPGLGGTTTACPLPLVGYETRVHRISGGKTCSGRAGSGRVRGGAG